MCTKIGQIIDLEIILKLLERIISTLFRSKFAIGYIFQNQRIPQSLLENQNHLKILIIQDDIVYSCGTFNHFFSLDW